MFQTVYSVAAIVCLCGLLVAAIWRGGPTEQAGAGLAALAWGATAFVTAQVADYVVWLAVIDFVTLVAFGVLTWRSSRDWPIIATAFQGVSLAMNLFYLFDPEIEPTLYFTALAVASFGVLGAIAYGVYTHALKPSTPAHTD